MEDNKYMPEALTCLPREELRRILAEELHKPAAEIDDALVRTLMAELRSRGPDPAYVDDAAVDQVCSEFKENSQKVQHHRKCWYQSWMLKVAAIVLVLGILFFALPGAAQANDISEVLSWWSDGVFQLFAPGSQPNTHTYVYETDHPGLQQIYDTVTELGITDPIVPRWVPDGFELAEQHCYPTLGSNLIHAHFSKKDSNILFTIIIHESPNNPLQYEKDIENTQIWDFADKEHFVLSNNDNQIVTWYMNGIECSLVADCPEEDVYKIIKSIYTSED